MGAEHPGTAAGPPQPGVFAVHVVDPVPEVPDERHRVDLLPHQVRRVPVEAESGPALDRFESADRRPVVVGDLARVHLVREPDPLVVEDVEDRVPAAREVPVTLVDDVVGDGREHGDVRPYLRAGEPDHRVDAEHPGDASGQLQLLRRALPDTFGIAVAPDAVPDDRLMAEVNGIVADGLAREVGRDRPEPETVLLEDPLAAIEVGAVLHGPPDVQVLTGAGEFKAVVTPSGRHPGDLLERQVDPLPGEQGDRLPAGRACSNVVLLGSSGTQRISDRHRARRLQPAVTIVSRRDELAPGRAATADVPPAKTVASSASGAGPAGATWRGWPRCRVRSRTPASGFSTGG